MGTQRTTGFYAPETGGSIIRSPNQKQEFLNEIQSDWLQEDVGGPHRPRLQGASMCLWELACDGGLVTLRDPVCEGRPYIEDRLWSVLDSVLLCCVRPPLWAEWGMYERLFLAFLVASSTTHRVFWGFAFAVG